MAISEARSTIAIRPLEAADLRRVRSIERAAYGSSNPHTPFKRELRNGLAQYLVAAEISQDDAADERTRELEHAAHGGVARWVRRVFASSEEDALILGFAGAWYTHDQLHLVTIAVDPKQQGRGIGQALLLAVIDLAIEAELDSVALEVRASNERAAAIYERFGFIRGGTLRNYYSDNGEDAVVMLLDGLAGPEPPPDLVRAREEYPRRFGDQLSAPARG